MKARVILGELERLVLQLVSGGAANPGEGTSVPPGDRDERLRSMIAMLSRSLSGGRGGGDSSRTNSEEGNTGGVRGEHDDNVGSRGEGH